MLLFNVSGKTPDSLKPKIRDLCKNLKEVRSRVAQLHVDLGNPKPTLRFALGGWVSYISDEAPDFAKKLAIFMATIDEGYKYEEASVSRMANEAVNTQETKSTAIKELKEIHDRLYSTLPQPQENDLKSEGELGEKVQKLALLISCVKKTTDLLILIPVVEKEVSAALAEVKEPLKAARLDLDTMKEEVSRLKKELARARSEKAPLRAEQPKTNGGRGSSYDPRAFADRSGNRSGSNPASRQGEAGATSDTREKVFGAV